MFMKKRVKKVKIKNLSKNLQVGSLNQRVLLSIIKSARRISKGLTSIAGAYAYILDGFDMRSVYQKFYGTYYANKEEQRIKEKLRQEWEIKKAVKQLQEMNYIKIDKNGKRVHLIDKGILELLRFKLQQSRPEWDKKWRIIIFDVPENRRKERDFLRSRLRWLGFKELQKSVWAFPYDIKKEIEDLLTICDFGTKGDIRFLAVEKIESDKDLRKVFDL